MGSEMCIRDRITARIKGNVREFHFGAPGRHQACNMLAGLAAVDAVGASLDNAITAIASLRAGAGRGARVKVSLPNGDAQLIDESYNANPASMAASIGLLGSSPCAGRRIAVLGEMLELGSDGPALHAQIAEQLVTHKVDLVFAAGSLMEFLWEKLPAKMRGLKAASAVDLVDPVLETIAPGDVVMVKGSNASKVSAVAAALSQINSREENA